MAIGKTGNVEVVVTVGTDDVNGNWMADVVVIVDAPVVAVVVCCGNPKSGGTTDAATDVAAVELNLNLKINAELQTLVKFD